MASLYQISQEIARLQDRVEYDADMAKFIDMDTGEILTEEELKAQFDDLQMDRQERMEWLAKCILNDRAEVDIMKAEKKRLNDRQKAKEKRIDLFMAILDCECAGKKTDLGVATLAYRKSKAVVFEEKDVPDIVAWLEEHGHDDCLKYLEPEIRKTELKTLIESGVHVPHAMVEQKNNASLK